MSDGQRPARETPRERHDRMVEGIDRLLDDIDQVLRETHAVPAGAPPGAQVA
ncbi:MAG TPA: hypothetical protein VMU75_02110 [Acidimicrobiales bacterium]|nr:hypothetical protein [Acidimicrobiales bacterium]